MVEVLNVISEQLEKLNIPYEFGEWTEEISYPYFVGSFTETEHRQEDGYTGGSFSLTPPSVPHFGTGSDTTSSYAAATGSTASLGNGTGRAEKTTTYEGGVAKEYAVDGKTSVCWRGKENFWGNIWKFVYGINIWGNGKMGGGQPYICSDFSFAESKNSGNYEPAGFTVTPIQNILQVYIT